jgi:hypothetical protein
MHTFIFESCQKLHIFVLYSTLVSPLKDIGGQMDAPHEAQVWAKRVSSALPIPMSPTRRNVEQIAGQTSHAPVGMLIGDPH